MGGEDRLGEGTMRALLPFAVSALAFIPPAFADAPTAFRSVILTQDQIAIVERDVAKTFSTPDSAIFGKLSAAKPFDGDIQVCGWVKPNSNQGQLEPYIGILGGTMFVVVKLGGGDVERGRIMEYCRQRSMRP